MMKPLSKLPPCCITNNSFPEFKRALMEFTMGRFGEAGKALRRTTPPVLPSFPSYPTINDNQMGCLVYARDSETPLSTATTNLACPLSIRGHSDFREDKAAYAKEMAKLTEYDSELLEVINGSISEASKQTMMAHHDYDAYSKSADGHWSYNFYQLLVATHETGDNSTKIYQTRQFFTCEQGTKSHEDYLVRIKALDTIFRSNFGSKTVGQESLISADAVLTAIYLSGLDQVAFSGMIEMLLKSYPTGAFPPPWEIMNKFQTYKANRMLSAPVDKISEQGAFVASAITSIPVVAAVPCAVCVSLGRTRLALLHKGSDCTLNPANKSKFSQSALDAAKATKLLYQSKRSGKLSNVSQSSPQTHIAALIASIPSTAGADARAAVYNQVYDQIHLHNASFDDTTV